METETPVPTLTLTPGPTFTPTLDIRMLTELSDGRGAEFTRTVSAGDYTTAVLLAAILFTLWGMWLYKWVSSLREGGRD